MPYKVKVERELDDQFMYDVMCTMVESGGSAVYYWTEVAQVHRDATGYEVLQVDLLHPETGKPVVIEANDVAKAIQTIVDDPAKHSIGYPAEYIRNAVLEGDAGDIDATAADCIAQVIVMGRVEFG